MGYLTALPYSLRLANKHGILPTQCSLASRQLWLSHRIRTFSGLCIPHRRTGFRPVFPHAAVRDSSAGVRRCPFATSSRRGAHPQQKVEIIPEFPVFISPEDPQSFLHPIAVDLTYLKALSSSVNARDSENGSIAVLQDPGKSTEPKPYYIIQESVRFFLEPNFAGEFKLYDFLVPQDVSVQYLGSDGAARLSQTRHVGGTVEKAGIEFTLSGGDITALTKPMSQLPAALRSNENSAIFVVDSRYPAIRLH